MPREPHQWLAARTALFDSSGIRKVFDLAASLEDPINLSIGQPDFDVPESIKDACIDAIQAGKNGYSQTQGIGPLREQLQQQVDERYGHPDRRVLITSGTSGALVLSMFAMLDPGDEVIYFDPYFVMYPPLIELAGGVPVKIDTYPHFQVDVQRVADAITPRTKMILLNTPNNPTGVSIDPEAQSELATLADERGVALLSDEIYSQFCYGGEFVSSASFNESVIVIDGFSKSHAMTGWRVGFAHGPAEVMDTMAKLQQYTFVCAPQPAQWAAAEALKVDIGSHREEYQRKRDRITQALGGTYEIVEPSGAFYVFPKVPWKTGTAFVEEAIRKGLLIIPGNIFSERDTHFRISYAADDKTIDRGIEVLLALAHDAP